MVEDKKIKVTCKGASTMTYDAMVPFQGGLKKLSKAAYQQLKRQILDLGYSEPVSIWEDGGNRILNGHQRRETIKQMVEREGYECPPLPVNLIQAKDEQEAKRKVLAFTSQFGQMTLEGLTEFSLDMGVTLQEMEELFRFPEIKYPILLDPIDEDDIPAAPKDAITKTGDVWLLGEHKLICGDATDPMVWSKLDIPKETLCFTSPPYNIGKNAKLRGKNASGSESLYLNTSDDRNDYIDMIRKVFAMSSEYCECTIINIQLLSNNKKDVIDFIHESKGFIDIITWDKGVAQPAMATSLLNSQFEWLLIFGKYSEKRVIPLSSWRGTVSNVYHGTPKKNEYADIHKAVFPMHLPVFVLRELCNESKYVVDCFSGTGTTMMAAEQLGKIAYGIELDPRYCDVTIQRWEKLTNGKAKKA